MPNNIIYIKVRNKNYIIDLYLIEIGGVNDEWSKHFGIENIQFISVDLKIFVFIESTVFPYWRWRSLMHEAFAKQWKNGYRIYQPNQTTSTVWPWS